MKLANAPRQKRSRQTFEALLDAAEELGLEKTYDQLSVQDIASHAGLTTGAFYARFPSKSTLLQALMDRYESMLDAARSDLADAKADDSLVRRLADSFVNAYRSNVGRFRVLETAVASDEAHAARVEAVRSNIVDFAIDTIERAYPLPRRDLETAVLLLVAPLRELHFKREFWPGSRKNANALTQRVVDAVIAFLIGCQAASSTAPKRRRTS